MYKNIIISFVIVICLTTNSFGQLIPNGSFENWTTTGSYEEPSGDFWATLNSLSNLAPFAPTTCSKTTDSRSGFAVKLTSATLGTFTVPGLLVSGSTGTFDLSNPAGLLKQGRPFTQKPELFKGYVKYEPVGSDSGVVFMMISKFNTTTNSRDTIAVATKNYYSSTNGYELFEILLDYKLENMTPDSVTVSFLSSGGAASFQGNSGSTLFVDDVELSLTNNIEEMSLKKEIELSFDLFTSEWKLQNSTNRTLNLRAINSTGQVVWKGIVHPSERVTISYQNVDLFINEN